MKDRYGRPIKSLRISITNKCNLNCFYCHKEGHLGNDRYLTSDDIKKIVETSVKFGVKKVKISGGEPLIRKDIVEIVEKIREVRGIEDISLTTNGTLLKKYAKSLKEAGLDRVNISLDSLNSEVYYQITKGNLTSVLEGIDEAVKYFYPIKINFVALTLNINEIDEFIDFCADKGVILQIIEFLPQNEEDRKFYVDIKPIEEKIKERAKKVIRRRLMHNRTKYILESGVEVEFVRPMDNSEFCAHCTRIRVTHDGYLKPCLLRDDNLVDILTPIRNGEDLEKYFLECIRRREPYFK
ncbi:GTP 3',8-cyclase MoaA [Methanocaldococcus indicus]|uniref:GTP 3',8-cyclase MoaA n=1 Tax=Methanocaldococcus indicus TaxID=213231 RepID=UPI003C6D010C